MNEDEARSRAVITLTEKTRVATMWSAGKPGVDVLGIVWKPEGEPWRITWRFRFHRDAKAFDSEDRKEWYRLEFPDQSGAGVAQAVEHFHTVMTTLVQEQRFQDLLRTDVNGDGVKAGQMLRLDPSAHIKPEGT